jgi:hypothetical protein
LSNKKTRTSIKIRAFLPFMFTATSKNHNLEQTQWYGVVVFHISHSTLSFISSALHASHTDPRDVPSDAEPNARPDVADDPIVPASKHIVRHPSDDIHPPKHIRVPAVAACAPQLAQEDQHEPQPAHRTQQAVEQHQAASPLKSSS